MRQPKVGLLTLYLELYDNLKVAARPILNEWHKEVADRLRAQGLEVVDTETCRIASEFEEAVDLFNKEDVDAVVTVHLAYSPSLEAQEALKKVKVPIIVMDTTPNYVYDQSTEQSVQALNHGIHGVQDLCNILIRNGNTFRVMAGHMDYSNVLERVANAARAAMMVHALKSSRVGFVGGPFKGMGDFSIPFEEMKADLGIEVIPYDDARGAKLVASVTEEEIRREYEKDKEQFVFTDEITDEIYEASAKTGLALRKWTEEEKLTAFTVTFLGAGTPGLPVMPFMECSKGMERGLGYAGEGDVLTAAFVGALQAGYENVSFTEMFCPNWRDNTVNLSHMGEFNYKIADGKPVMYQKPFVFTNAENPTVAYATFKPGKIVFVNLAPFREGRYTLTIIPGEMLKIEGYNAQAKTVNGWFRAEVPVDKLLEGMSTAGATHHSALIYDADVETLELFADFLGINKVVIK